MPKFVQRHQSQLDLLPPDLRDWLPEDDLAHVVVEAVERVPLERFQVNERGTGSAQYHPRRYCQVDDKLVDRPPRYWARASREPAMLGIRNGRQPQLDNTQPTRVAGVDAPAFVERCQSRLPR